MVKSNPTSRDLQAEERRKQLLQAAKQLFAEQGFHATPVRAINRSIGIADGLLYHYFPQGKQQMLETIVEEAFEGRFEVLEQITSHLHDHQISLKEALMTLLEKLYEVISLDHEATMIMFKERAHFTDDFTAKFSTTIIQRLDWVADFLRSRHEAGEIVELDYPIAARQIISINFIFVVRELAGIDIIQESHHEFVEKSIDHLLRFWLVKQT